MKSLYIFTRDLRIEDNKTFNKASKSSSLLAPIFVFTPEQVTSNSYKSDNAIQFMINCLKELNKNLKNALSLFYGETDKIVEKLIKRHSFKQIFITKDYTPYSNKREEKLQKICDKNNATLFVIDDYCLHNPGTILTGGGTAYQKYTPYYRSALKIDPDKPLKKEKLPKLLKLKSDYDFTKADKLYKENPEINREGGREEGLKNLALIKEQKNYGATRNDLEKETTNLSAYNKFGCISIREVYWKVRTVFNKNHPLIAQLIWRDFYYQIGVAYPHVIGSSLKEKYDSIVWDSDKSTLKAWKEGRTGYPIVDASMNQINKTGYMHNRGRLIVASFLVKTLLHSWQEGEKYFAQKLSDYDPLVNNGNWQWVSGSGADSQPYFRVFNPWLQSKKHDPDGKYIKKWLPQLKDVEPKHLHEWDKYCNEYKGKIDYPSPIVDYKEAKEKTLKAYKKALY
jgi:deoxyribodipyrimidine photo-lyase